MAKAAVAVLAVLLLVAAMGSGGASAAQQCDSSRLADCAPAFVFGVRPSQSCCDKLHEEERSRCLCVYARDPRYSNLVSSSNKARNVLAACGVAYPTGC